MTVAIFAVSRALEINAGLRLDYFDALGTVPSPRLSVIVKPTDAQKTYMAGLDAGDSPASFLAGFPGDYIAAGFRTQSYGDVELGRGLWDQFLNPFNGGFYDPEDPNYTGPTPFSLADGRPLLHGRPGGERLRDRHAALKEDGQRALLVVEQRVYTYIALAIHGRQQKDDAAQG